MFTHAFITGGSSFVGLHLIRTLRSHNIQVSALVGSEEAAEKVRDAGATPVSGHLNDQTALREGMNGCEVVFHIETLGGVGSAFDDLYRVNVSGTKEVLLAARAAGVSRFIYTSTESVLLGSGSLKNVDESRSRPRRPSGAYASIMGMAEEEVLKANSAELATVVVRPRLIWGPGDTSSLPQFVAVVNAGKFVWIGDGHHLTSTCHVRNLCEGLLLAAERGSGGEIYFLCDKEPIEWRAFITSWLGTVGLAPGDRQLPLWLAKLIATSAETIWKVFRLKGSPPITRTAVQLMGEEITLNDTKARRDLGYIGEVSHEAGLAELRALAGGSPSENREREVSA